MSDLKQINNAENHLIVGSLEVLGDIEGSSLKTIKRTVSKLAESVQATNTAMENYWGGIGADNIVTPAEKEILYSKWQTLEQTFTAIRKIATDREITDTADYISLHELYDNLHDYIFNELKLFDEMDSKTVLPDTEHFNELFENYYKQQINFQSILSSTTTTIRTVSNLNAAGTENEVVIYKNRFFKYSNGKWVSFDSPEYEGVLEELPEDIINHYFVAGKQGGFRDTFKIKVNKKYLVNEDEQYVTVSSKLFEYGYIYVYTQYNGWQKVTDKNNWRYTVALNDLIANNIPISTELENYLQAKEDSAVERANQNTNTAINNIHTPANLGVITSFPPDSYGKGDYFLWGANDTIGTYTYGETTNTVELNKGYVYKFDNDVWSIVNHRISKNAGYYISFLKEILELTGASSTNEYFGSLFVGTLLTSEAFIEKLTVSDIESSNWSDVANTGYKLFSESGTLICNDGLFRGSIEAGALELLPGKGTTVAINLNTSMACDAAITYLKSLGLKENLVYTTSNAYLNTSTEIFSFRFFVTDEGTKQVSSWQIGDWSWWRNVTTYTYNFMFSSTQIKKTAKKYVVQYTNNFPNTNTYSTEWEMPKTNFTFTGVANNGIKKFKLKGIPNSAIDAETNEVFIGTKGNLRIKYTQNMPDENTFSARRFRLTDISESEGEVGQIYCDSFGYLRVKKS